MSNLKYVAFYLSFSLLFNVYSCDKLKNVDVTPGRNSLSPELIKDQFDHVQIDYQNISTITRDLLWQLTMVKNLEIEHCKVHTIEKGAFRRLSSLRKLNLKHNLLEEITDGVFSETNLVELNLDNNQIKTIHPDAFKWMFQLNSISLNNNKIGEFNNQWFTSTNLLCYMSFEHNLIKALPNHIVQNRYYTWIGIDFIFSHNEIEEVDENTFQYMYHVGRLYLDHNKLANIKNETFSRVHDIDELRLDHNNIICTTANIRSTKKLKVEDNPWNQTCLMALQEQKN